MNKLELIDKAVHELNGVLPKSVNPSRSGYFYWASSVYDDGVLLCDVGYFQQRARELGYVNGYRFGVEYPTNGEKPDLSDDVVINIKNQSYKDEWVDKTCWGRKVKNTGSWEGVTAFKITDERYKPADTSYLNEPAVKYSLTDDWYDYTNQKALRLPPVGDKSASYLAGDGVWIGCEIAAHYKSGAIVAHNDGFTLVYKHELRPKDWNHKAEAERKRVVDAAFTVFIEAYFSCAKQGLCALYDAGFLRMPEGK